MWKTLNISHDVWQCQLGQTGQLISLINFSLRQLNHSVIKDLYTVCQNSVRSQRRATRSEKTCGSAEHENVFVPWNWKLTKTVHKLNERLGISFLPKVSPKWHVRALNVMISWKPGKGATVQQPFKLTWRKQLLFSDYNIMVCDDVTIGMSRSDGHYRQ